MMNYLRATIRRRAAINPRRPTAAKEICGGFGTEAARGTQAGSKPVREAHFVNVAITTVAVATVIQTTAHGEIPKDPSRRHRPRAGTEGGIGTAAQGHVVLRLVDTRCRNQIQRKQTAIADRRHIMPRNAVSIRITAPIEADNRPAVEMASCQIPLTSPNLMAGSCQG